MSVAMPTAVPTILFIISTSEECLVSEKYCNDSIPNVKSVAIMKTNAAVFSDDSQRLLSAA
jgi:hypothetical protein